MPDDPQIDRDHSPKQGASQAASREAALREILKVISESRDDQAPVFDVILKNAARLCDAPFAGLYLLDGSRRQIALVASLGARTEYLTGKDRRWPINDPASVGVAIRECRVVQADDIRNTDAYRAGNKQRVEAADIEGIRTFLGVPLMHEGVAIGAIGLYRREVAPFAEPQVALVETFAAQAVIAIENVRQFRELQTRLEREEATREILHVISQNRDDEIPVFEAILDRAQRLCHAQAAGLQLVNPERTRSRFVVGVGSKFRAFKPRDEFDLDGSTALALAVREARVIHIEDLKDSHLYRDGHPLRVKLVDEEGVRTQLTVPLLKDGIAFGTMTLSRYEQHPFAEDEIALVETFASQAVIAIENVRQFRELQTRLEREEASREILQVISSSRDDTAPVFEVILRNAARLSGAPLANLCLLNAARSHWHLVAHFGDGLRHLSIGQTTPMDSDLVPATAMRTAQVAQIEDLTDTDRYRQGDPGRIAMADVEGMRTIVGVPLLRGTEAIGCITLFRREVKAFTVDEIALVETFASQAVIAIENMRQFRELQERLEREEATSEVLGVISSSRDDDQPVFDVILENAANLCNAPHAFLQLRNDQDTHLEVSAQNFRNSKFLDRLRVNPIPTQNNPGSISVLGMEASEPTHYEDIRDLRGTERYTEQLGYAMDDEGMRTALFVPLISEGRGIGVIVLYRLKVAPFRPDEIALVQTFAAQAVIAIENVRQFREVQTRLEHERATGEVLEVVSQSRDDEKPVFQAILKKAQRLCGAEGSGLQLVNEAGTHLRIQAVVGEDGGSFPEGTEFDLNSPIGMCVAVRQGRVEHIQDLKETDLYRQGHEGRRKLVDVEGVRTHLNVPLMRSGAAFGNITLSRKRPEPFSSNEIALVETFAAQAVIAIENVRQFRELQTRLEREAATRDILEVISRSRDDDQPVFDIIIENAARLCNTPFAFLMLRNAANTHLEFAAENFADSTIMENLRAHPYALDNDQLLSIQALNAARVWQIPDLSKDPAYANPSPQITLAVEQEKLRTLLYVPLLKNGQAIGLLGLFKHEVSPFRDDEIALVETFAAQAVIAIENVRQFKALEDRTAEVENLNAGLEDRVETQVGELERMGRLKRFLSPQVADAIVSTGSDRLLTSHRSLLGILFCDIRGFTAFCETAEPEETIEVLQTYHEEMGKLIVAHGAGVDHRSGDGIMVLFNDPLPCDDPAGAALRLGLDMRGRMQELCAVWKRLGHRLGFGVGISLGYATVGMVGSEGRFDYTASGTAVNLASRLCDTAEDGEILLSPRAQTAVEDDFATESAGVVSLKGIREPVEAFRVIDGRS